MSNTCKLLPNASAVPNTKEDRRVPTGVPLPSASAALVAKGYKVTNLQGGILAWIEEKKPVVK